MKYIYIYTERDMNMLVYMAHKYNKYTKIKPGGTIHIGDCISGNCTTKGNSPIGDKKWTENTRWYEVQEEESCYEFAKKNGADVFSVGYKKSPDEKDYANSAYYH